MMHSIPRGLLKFLIIRMMYDKDLTGSQIMQIFEERTKGKWKPSPGSIYPLLKNLEDEGIIETVHTEGRSKLYRLTDTGRARLKQMMKQKEFRPRAQIGRMIWFHLFDPAERLEFQINGISNTIKEIHAGVDKLKKNSKKRLVRKLDLLLEALTVLRRELSEEERA